LLSDHLGALLCAALEPPQPPAPTAARSLHAHLCALIRARIDQPGLSAPALAQEAGVSLRTLHRAFAAQGHTFAGALRELRRRVQASCCAAPSWPMWPWARLGGAAALRTLRISHAPSSAPWACRPRSGGAAADSVSKSSVSLLLRLAVLQHCLRLRA
jgi:hypothetical protein